MSILFPMHCHALGIFHPLGLATSGKRFSPFWGVCEVQQFTHAIKSNSAKVLMASHRDDAAILCLRCRYCRIVGNGDAEVKKLSSNSVWPVIQTVT
jgi:hypothetical protein